MNKAISTPRERGLLALGALGAGFVNGLCGAGGGVILYFVLGAVLQTEAKERLILSSAAVWIFCVISLLFYAPNAALSLSDVFAVGVPAAIGGSLGAFLQQKIPTAALRTLFSLLIIISGILLLVR